MKNKTIPGRTSKSLVKLLAQKRPDLLRVAEEQPLRVTVGKNLLRLRFERGLSRQALAGKTDGIGPRTIQRIEEAVEDSNPTLRVIEELSAALEVDPLELMDPRATVAGEARP